MSESGYRLPPCNAEAEIGVLGSVMIDHTRALEACALHKITEESFYIPAHRELFKTFLSMASNLEAVDMITVMKHLKSVGKLEAIGGYTFLESLIDSTPTAAHVGYYAEFVQRDKTLRDIIDQATSTIDACYQDDPDPENILARNQSDMFEISNASRLSEEETIGDTALKVCDRWEGIMLGEVSFGLEPFIPEIADILGNFVQGNPYFIAAEPGGGKSVILQNQFTFWSVLQGKSCAIASLEMTKEKLVSRILADRGDLSSWAMDNRRFGDSPMARKTLEQARVVARELDNVPLHIADKPMDIDEFCAWGLQMVTKHKIEAIGLDYFQLMNAPSHLKLTGQDALKYICGKLQNFSKSTGVIPLVLSQITKLPRDPKTGKASRPPRQDDLYGGRIIDAHSEGTLFVWEDDGTKVLIEKNRNGGEGQVDVDFVKNRSRFVGLRDEAEPEPVGDEVLI